MSESNPRSLDKWWLDFSIRNLFFFVRRIVPAAVLMWNFARFSRRVPEHHCYHRADSIFRRNYVLIRNRSCLYRLEVRMSSRMHLTWRRAKDRIEAFCSVFISEFIVINSIICRNYVQINDQRDWNVAFVSDFLWIRRQPRRILRRGRLGNNRANLMKFVILSLTRIISLNL